jgi:hypothetical protein
VAYVDGGGVGSDAVFNQISSLYNKEVSMPDFYNMSDGSREVNNVTGMPFGFFHAPLKGFDDGYPLLFDTHVSEKRVVDLLHYVQDGGLLSALLTRRCAPCLCCPPSTHLLPTFYPPSALPTCHPPRAA